MSLREAIAVSILAVNPISREYDSGDLIFPATSLEIEDAFQKAKVTQDREYFVEILSSPLLPKLCEIRIDGPVEPKEMNVLALQLQNLPQNELTALGGLLMRKVSDIEEDSISIEELINMTYNLKDVIVVHNVSNVRELGAFAIENGLAEAYGLGKETLEYADLEAVGIKQKEMDNGQFYNGSYVVTAGYEVPKIYQSPPKKDLVVANNYAFALKIAEAPVNDSEETADSAEWIYLPEDKEYINGIAKIHNEGSIEDCVFYDFKSVFKSIDSQVFGDMQDFDKLNEIAARYTRLNNASRVKFKAVVEKEQPKSLDDVLEISDNLNRYAFSCYDTTNKQFAKSYLACNLPSNFDTEFLDNMPLWEIGNVLVNRLNVAVTEYGAVSERDKGLYEVITPNMQIHKKINTQEQGAFETQDEGYGGMTM